ncbi:mitochondrial carrier [Testicularia cyperi]|uniref:Mitochondrial carrier n=1 Tax=Testicularia cyperi TaxID=1882483 RepID=A0A317XW26_9BASI|nr:mitochondrial carrier [Testicularia cyperi]
MSSANSASGSVANSVSNAVESTYQAVKDVPQGVRKSASTPTQTAQRKDKPLYSLIAGTTAGAVEGFATYPIEYTKTVSQFAAKAGEKAPGPISIVRTTIAKDGFLGLYSGCGALVTGNAIKAGVRFLSYDHFKTMLKDEQGKLSGPRSLLAGLGAGMMEAVFAVTPSETIKTKLIDDGKRAVPKYPRGLFPGTAAIVKEEGIRGIYRGLFPVMLRQGANSAVRFGTYSTLKNFVAGSTRPGQSLPGGITFGIGAVAGIVTVCTYSRPCSCSVRVSDDFILVSIPLTHLDSPWLTLTFLAFNVHTERKKSQTPQCPLSKSHRGHRASCSQLGLTTDRDDETRY